MAERRRVVEFELRRLELAAAAVISVSRAWRPCHTPPRAAACQAGRSAQSIVAPLWPRHPTNATWGRSTVSLSGSAGREQNRAAERSNAGLADANGEGGASSRITHARARLKTRDAARRDRVRLA